MDLWRFFRRPAPADPRALRGETLEIATSVATFLTRTGLFDREAYLQKYPDVAMSGLDPLHHFAMVGMHAGRSFASPATIARVWQDIEQQTPPSSRGPAKAPTDSSVAIYVSSHGNFFMREIADVLKAGFDDAGVRAIVLDENAKPPAATHHVVVAPHEFFVLGEGKRWANDAFVRSAIMLATEQVQSPWFARSLIFLLRAKAVADINEQNAALLRKGRVNAAAVQPGYSPSFLPLAAPAPALPDLPNLPNAERDFEPSESFAERPLDLLFLGSHTARRERLLDQMALRSTGLRTYIHLRHMDRPLQPATDPMASTAVTAALLMRSKVLLNIHRDDDPYFEWWRLMQAFWLKTVVVTEPCFPHSLYKPGRHFFEETPGQIPQLLDWLTRSDEGRAKAEEVRARAHTDFIAHSAAKTAALALLALTA